MTTTTTAGTSGHPDDDTDVSTAANMLDNIENGIWHAFDFLANEGDATAPKTKLKVRQVLGELAS